VLTDQGADDSAWQAAAAKLLELTGDVPLGLYECPVPYKRLLSPALIRWCAQSGRFTFHKDTCCRMKGISEKLDAVQGTPFMFYNANVETLLDSMRAGGKGFSGISANFYPHLHAWLTKSAQDAKGTKASEAETKKQERVQDFLSLAEATVCVNYPASAKAYLEQLYEGGISTRCRTLGPDGQPKGSKPFDEHQLIALAAMGRMQRSLSRELGIDEFDLKTGKRVD
jgi:4-hydroxy-tetrahydrodipicolinate synthase